MSVYLRWGSSSIDIVGADTRKLRGPKRRVLIVHETIRSRLSVDRSLVRMIGRALPSGLYWCAYIHRLDTVHAVKCNQRNLELDVSRTFAVTSTSSRWMNVGTESRAALDRRTRHDLPHFLNRNFTKVAEQQTFMANIRRRRRRQHALLQPSRRKTRQVCRRYVSRG